MSNSRLFEYAVLWHPTDKQRKDGESSKLLVPPKTILSRDEKSAQMSAVMEIPQDYKDQLDQVEIALRPF